MLVYVATPYRAYSEEVFQKQLNYTKKVSRELALNKFTPIAPHLCFPSFLNDDIQEEREVGMECAKELLTTCKVVFSSTNISEGMEAEIDLAEKLNIPVYFFKNIDELKSCMWKAKIDLGQENKK